MKTKGLRRQEAAREAALKAIAALRRQASAEIERLIAFMDETDGYSTHELEAAIDDGPCCDDEREKNMSGTGAHHVANQHEDKDGELEAAEGDDEPSAGFDDPELDKCDDEPSLGWTEGYAMGAAGMGQCADKELDGSYLTKAARKRKGKAKGIGVERRFMHSELTNVSPRQKELLGGVVLI